MLLIKNDIKCLLLNNKMVYINLNNYIKDDNINVIEIYFINKLLKDGIIDVRFPENVEDIISKLYKKTKEEKYKMYFMNDKIYIYELSNDNQYVIAKNKKVDDIIKLKTKEVYLVGCKIDKYPQYVFPCTNDIDNISETIIKEYKISNRISLMIKNEANKKDKTIILEYKHSNNVEIDKINEIVNKIIRNLEAALNNEDK